MSNESFDYNFLDKRISILENDLKNLKENEIKPLQKSIEQLNEHFRETTELLLDVRSKIEKQENSIPGLKEDLRELGKDFPNLRSNIEKNEIKLQMYLAIMVPTQVAIIGGLVKLIFFG